MAARPWKFAALIGLSHHSYLTNQEYCLSRPQMIQIINFNFLTFKFMGQISFASGLFRESKEFSTRLPQWANVQGILFLFKERSTQRLKATQCHCNDCLCCTVAKSQFSLDHHSRRCASWPNWTTIDSLGFLLKYRRLRDFRKSHGLYWNWEKNPASQKFDYSMAQ